MKPMTDGEAARLIQGASTQEGVSEALSEILRSLGMEDTARAVDLWGTEDRENLETAEATITKAIDAFEDIDLDETKSVAKFRKLSWAIWNILDDYRFKL